MKRHSLIIILFLTYLVLLAGCASRKNAATAQPQDQQTSQTQSQEQQAQQTHNLTINAPIDGYKYVFIPNSNPVVTAKDDTDLWTKEHYTSIESAYPYEIIASECMKRGYVILHELKPELEGQTMIVNHAIGSRKSRLGYLPDITIQMISAKTNELLRSATAWSIWGSTAVIIKDSTYKAMSLLLNAE